MYLIRSDGKERMMEKREYKDILEILVISNRAKQIQSVYVDYSVEANAERE